MKQSQRIVKNVVAGGFAVGLGGLLQLAAVVLVARSVSVSDFGIYCLAIGKFQQFTNLGVDKPVIIKDCVLESIAGLILVMGFIHIRPECMMDTVHSYFDHHEIVPIPFF
jgi:hypothetical protein